MIILGLEWTVTDQELRSYFEQFGEVAHCEVRRCGHGNMGVAMGIWAWPCEGMNVWSWECVVMGIL